MNLENIKGKIDFSVKFHIGKKNIRAAVIAFLVMLGFSIYGQASLLPAVICGIAYLLIKGVTLKLPEKANYLWLTIELILSSIFTEQLIQYMLLEYEDRIRTTMNKTVLNVLCCMVVYLVFLFVSTNVVKSFMTAHISLLSFAGVDYFVYQFRGNELTVSDFKSAATGLSVVSEYTFTLESRAVLAIILSIVYVALIRKIRLQFRRKSLLRCICICAAVLAVTRVALKSQNVNTESWEQKGTYRNGYILNFVLSIRDSFVEKPENYSLDTISDLETQYPADVSEVSVDEDAPTIIAIMDESFADLGVIGNLQTNEEVTPFISSMDTNVIKGYALSSVFGAKTPNSEWEFLTGNSMAFLPSGSVAYQQYVSGETYSLVSVLQNYGYTCSSMHPYYSTGWSRNRIYPLLGFTESLFLEDFAQTNMVRDYVSDQEMFDKIIEKYESAEPGEKQFIFGITMQNHGGYTDSYDNFTETIRTTNGYFDDANQYLSLLAETDRAVENLITYFENVDDNVIICFFGDHQPSLQSSFYRQLNGKGLSGLTTDELEDLFKVPFFIWTNYETGTEEIKCTSLNYLSTLMLERAGLELPAYNQFLADMMDVVPSMNSRGYYSNSAGRYVHYEDAAGEEAEMLDQYQVLQYNNIFDKTDKSSVFFTQYINSEE